MSNFPSSFTSLPQGYFQPSEEFPLVDYRILVKNENSPPFGGIANLTIGVEIEAACWCPKDHPMFKSAGLQPYGLWNSDRYKAVFREQIVLEALRRAGLRARLDGSGSTPESQRETIDRETRQPVDVLRQTHHFLTTDGSIKPEGNDTGGDGGKNFFIGFEISTPPIHCGTALFNEIRTLTDVLRNIGAFVNSECGLHVHVGQGTRGFSLPHLRNLFLFVVGFAPQFRQMHPSTRSQQESYSSCPTKQFINPKFSWQRQKIEACNTMNRFLALAHAGDLDMSEIGDRFDDLLTQPYVPAGGKYRALNFLNLISGRSQTIEFRSHKGTIDAREIERWVKTIAICIEFTGESPWDKTWDKIIDLQENGRKRYRPEYTILDVFREIGAPYLAEAWKSSIWFHSLSHWDPFRSEPDTFEE